MIRPDLISLCSPPIIGGVGVGGREGGREGEDEEKGMKRREVMAEVFGCEMGSESSRGAARCAVAVWGFVKGQLEQGVCCGTNTTGIILR